MSKTPISSSGDSGNECPSYNNLLSVYCRLKPLNEPGTNSISIVNSKTVCITSSTGNSKDTYFTFNKVFPPNSTQKEVFDGVALGLVERVLQGQNALLFTYGNTGSGKTYTMKGTLQEGGIMPRCLDVIFNSISSRLAKKHIFKSDKFNGFEIQTEKEAATDTNRVHMRQIGIGRGFKGKMVKKADSDPDLAERLIDPSNIAKINNSNTFSVFITFIEIYNNNTYDLLDEYFEDHHHPKPPQTKVIREDSKKNMFVLGVTEVEVRSTEEAYEVFYKGLKKRRVAQTALNAQSSRSHSVFNIRVVQANLEGNSFHRGSNQHITISQLSLVDLAGSERTNRTQNTGKKLKEAGNINNSLMSLRQCFDALRENQRGGSRMVPYRESKLTTLFKSFFEGEGFISMVICINQHVDNSEENMHVLKFAETSQEIHIRVPIHKEIEYDLELRSQRTQEYLRRVNEELEFIKQERKRKKTANNRHLVCVQLPPAGDIFPLTGRSFLSEIQNKSDFINEDQKGLNPSELDNNDICEICKVLFEAKDLKASIKQEKEKHSVMEMQYNALKRKYEDVSKSEKKIKKELLEKEKAVLKSKAEKDREKEKFMQKKNVYKEKYTSELEKRLKRQRTELEMQIQYKENKLARVQRVLSDEVISTSSTPSVASCRAKFEKIGTPFSVPSTPRGVISSEVRPTVGRPHIAVSNRRHRRSRSTGDVWVEHKAAMPVPLGTVLQPVMQKRRSITKLTDAKQVTQGASKYCLMTQTQDSDGDLETRLYKGDVIPTTGGGAQVLFNDVEVLKQISPDATPKRPHAKEEFIDRPSCSYAIEGHRLRSHK